MLRIIESQSARGAVRYFESNLETGDYYAKGDERGMGVWGGMGAERLGLKGFVKKSGFTKLVHNQRPGTIEQLTARMDSDRRPGYDFNFNLPKSVSVYLAETRDATVEEIVREAYRETVVDIEARAECRVRRGNQDGDRTTGNLVYATYEHRITRPVDGISDPHFHFHCYVFNATYDPVEERWKAVQLGNIQRDAPFFEAAFHFRTAQKLVEAGYKVRRTDFNYELASVGRELIDKFSKRSKQIEKMDREQEPLLHQLALERMKRTGESYDEARAGVKGELGAKTRSAKSTEVVSPEERLAHWRSSMTAEERESVSSGAVQSGSSVGVIPIDEAKRLVVGELFERLSVARPMRAAALLLRRAIGGSLKVRDAAAFARDDPRFVQGSDELVTTGEVLEEERALLQAVFAGRGSVEALGGREEWEIRDPQVARAEDQRLAVEHVLKNRDLLTSVRGAAGSGKSTMTREAVTAIEALSGKQVVVLAPSSSAVAELRGKGFERVETFQRFREDPRLQAEARGRVIWSDEAGFLSLKEMFWLVKFAEEQGARVILSGDSRQHHGVERGDALRILEVAGAVDQAALTTIFRQQIAVLRGAIESLAAGRTAEGFDTLDQHGVIKEVVDKEERLSAISEQQLLATEKGKTSLIVAPTHAECRQVAEAVRQRLRELGKLGKEEREFSRLEDLRWTQAQREDLAQYEPGMVIEFHRRTKGNAGGKFLSGDQWEVRLRDRDRVIVRRGEVETDLPLAQARNFSVYRPQTLKLSVGDQVRVTKNFVARDFDGKHRCRNNDVHSVMEVSEQGIRLSNNVELRRGGWHIDQGLVVTSHASQGKTVDQVIVSMPLSASSQANAAQFYVSMSRARRAMHVFTDCKSALREAVLKPSDRLSGSELVGELARNRRSNFEREIRRIGREVVQLAGIGGRPEEDTSLGRSSIGRSAG